MSEATSNQTPPYLSYVTFKSTIQGLALDGKIPRQIDHSVFPTLSGSTRKTVIAALRFFDLIEDSGAPTERLVKLVHADEPQWKEFLEVLLTDRFPEQINVLPDASPKSLRDSFAGSFGRIGASLVEPSVRFLVAAARDAGIPVSGRLTQRKARVAGSNQRGRPSKQAKQALLEDDGTQSPSNYPGADSFRAALLSKFPDFDPSWTVEQQSSWFSAYEKLLGMHGDDEASAQNTKGQDPC